MRYRAKAWLGLVAYVVAVEVIAPPGELLSEAFDDWLTTRAGRVACTAITVSVAGHLLNVIPPRFDWIHQLSNISSPRKSRPVDGQIPQIDWQT